MSSRKKAILKQFTEICLWMFVFYVCIMVKQNVNVSKKDFVSEPEATVNITIEQSVTTEMPLNEKVKTEMLKCEETWDQVLKAREKKFTNLINPTHLVVNQFLDIVTSNKMVCDGILENREDSGDAKLAIVIVNSERGHFNERKMIRKSWGQMKQWDNWEIRTVFVLGQNDFCLSNDTGKDARKTVETEENEIQEEVEKYGDILIGSFTDSLRNNSYKHLIGYKFVLESCPQAELIIKTEDNIFLNLPEVLKTRIGHSYDMLCQQSKNLWPVRCSKCESGKYFVTEEEWRSDRYPPYCQGSLLAVSKSWAEDLYEARGLAGYFWIEEIFVTGLLKEAAEKEFGKEARIYVTNGMVKNRRDGEDWVKQLCKQVDKKNLKDKRNQLGIYERVEGKNKEKWMGCLWNIVSGSNLPFSTK